MPFAVFTWPVSVRRRLNYELFHLSRFYCAALGDFLLGGSWRRSHKSAAGLCTLTDIRRPPMSLLPFPSCLLRSDSSSDLSRSRVHRTCGLATWCRHVLLSYSSLRSHDGSLLAGSLDPLIRSRSAPAWSIKPSAPAWSISHSAPARSINLEHHGCSRRRCACQAPSREPPWGRGLQSSPSSGVARREASCLSPQRPHGTFD
jgi:hypothetical protein